MPALFLCFFVNPNLPAEDPESGVCSVGFFGGGSCHIHITGCLLYACRNK